MKDKIGVQDKISFVLNGVPIEPAPQRPDIPKTLAELIKQEQERDQQVNRSNKTEK